MRRQEMTEPQGDTATSLLAIDHLALRVADPEQLGGFLCDHCGMQSAESEEGFSVLGAPGDSTKLFLFEADEPPHPGVLQRVVLRLSDLEQGLAMLPGKLEVHEIEPQLVVFQGPQDLELGFTSVLGGVDYDVDHVVLRALDPDETTIALAALGFVPQAGALQVADKQVRLQSGIRSAGENELLSHMGVLVESVEAVRGQAWSAGYEIDELTLAPNKLGVYVPGPERIRVEYAERSAVLQ
jgi:catechol 2,3-dioxygenase-like lactoylglutathione lyase family enzyme